MRQAKGVGRLPNPWEKPARAALAGATRYRPAKGHSRRSGRTPIFRFSERLTVLRQPVALGNHIDRDKYHCQSWLYTAEKKIKFFSRKPTAFWKILERSLVGPNEPVNVCKFQSSTLNCFFFWRNFQFFRTQSMGGRTLAGLRSRSGPSRQRRVSYADQALGGRLIARLWPRAEALHQRRLSYTRPVTGRKPGRAALAARMR